ncbi:MAG TPA: hypothetical protein VFX29_04660 [Longimicrobiaceae bacterium]|jgi:hypothetical protein|nr:hypothetical protein [Longimicrobiaceae bacterium]
MRRKPNHSALLALFTLLLALAVPTHVRAQSAAFNGTFTYDAAASDDINKAIEQGIAKMNFITRPVARGRLKKTNEPYKKIVIAQTPSEVSITTDNRAAIVTPANGTAIKWKREDGEVLDVHTAWADGKLVQEFDAEDGKRINSYTISGDGNTLTMHVTVSSPRLPKPITYNLVYRRQA